MEKKNILLLLFTEILKCHVKDCFKINGKQRIIMPKKGEWKYKVTIYNFCRF